MTTHVTVSMLRILFSHNFESVSNSESREKVFLTVYYLMASKYFFSYQQALNNNKLRLKLRSTACIDIKTHHICDKHSFSIPDNEIISFKLFLHCSQLVKPATTAASERLG